MASFDDRHDPSPGGVPPLPPGGTEPNPEARQWAMFCHLSALAGYAIPLGNIVGPLIVWSMKRDVYPFVDDQGKEALNFQISITIYLLLALASICIGIGIVLAPALAVVALVLMIVGGIKASSGEAYRYPLTIRFVK